MRPLKRELTNMFSSECFASQQLRKTGMKRCRREGKKICERVGSCSAVRDGTWLSTHREHEWNCRHQLQYEVERENLLPYVALVTAAKSRQLSYRSEWILPLFISPCNSDTLWVEPRSMTPSLAEVAQPKVPADDSPTGWRPNWWWDSPGTPPPSSSPIGEMLSCCPRYSCSYRKQNQTLDVATRTFFSAFTVINFRRLRLNE